MLVLGQDVGLVDPVPRRGQAGRERGLRVLEPEDDGVGRERFHGLHVLVLGLAARDDGGRWIDDAIVGGLDVPGGHHAAVVELHALAQLEGVGALVRGDGPRLGEVANELGARLVEGIDAQQRVVVGRGGMEHPEGLFPVRVIARRLGRDHEDQLAPVARLVLGKGRASRPEHGRQAHEDHRHSTAPSHHGPPEKMEVPGTIPCVRPVAAARSHPGGIGYTWHGRRSPRTGVHE